MTDSNEIFDIVIIGAGCAGLSAAMYAGRFGLKTVAIGELPGGTITQTHIVENFPTHKSITGLELGMKFQEHAKEYNVPINMESVKSVKKLDDGKFEVVSDTRIYIAKTVIFATGTEWRELKVLGEKEFKNKGVHYCALCDGAFYKNKIITVVGSGDSAAKESLLLAEFAQKVNILVRGDRLKGEPINNQRVSENKKIEIFTGVEVKEIKGNEKVTHLHLNRAIKPKELDEESDLLKTDAVFILIGHIAKTELAKELGVELNKKGEILINRNSETNLEGVYAAGDCCDTHFKQAIISSAEGVHAAYSASQYMKEKGI
jgi:thioredoxin-disulfide reductase